LTDEQASRWSWGTTLLCASYVLWLCYVFGSRIPVFGTLFAGFGGELPRITTFVLALAKGPIYILGALVVLGLVLKELLVKELVIRFALTIIVLIVVAWFIGFATDAMYKPMFELLDKIG
jgi:type II secretory pathway component PulF